MVGALPRSEASHLTNEEQDYQKAAGAYLVWPLAIAALAGERPAASRWARIHTRQAFMFGLCATVGFIVLMALPAIVVIVDHDVSTGQTVWIYTAGMLADLIVFVALLVAAFSYAARAGRGELFPIPIVSALADRVFRSNR